MFVKMVVDRLHSVDWPLVSIHKPGPATTDAEEPFNAFSNRLPMATRHVVLVVATVENSAGLITGAAVVAAGHRVGVATMTTGGSGGILDIRGIANRRGTAWSAVATVMTTTTVSVGGMRPSVLVTLGRRPVAPGVGRFRSCNMIELLAGRIGP